MECNCCTSVKLLLCVGGDCGLGIQDFLGKLGAHGLWESAGTLGFRGTGCKFTTEDCTRRSIGREQPTLDFLSKLQQEMKNLVAKTSNFPSGNLQEDGSISPGPRAAGEFSACKSCSGVCALLCPSRTLASAIGHSLEPASAPLGKKHPENEHFVPWEKEPAKESHLQGWSFREVL